MTLPPEYPARLVMCRNIFGEGGALEHLVSALDHANIELQDHALQCLFVWFQSNDGGHDENIRAFHALLGTKKLLAYMSRHDTARFPLLALQLVEVLTRFGTHEDCAHTFLKYQDLMRYRSIDNGHYIYIHVI